MSFRRTILVSSVALLSLASAVLGQEVVQPTPSNTENSPSGLNGGEAPAGNGGGTPALNGPRLKAPAGSSLPADEAPATNFTEPQLMPDAVPPPNRSFDRPTTGSTVPLPPAGATTGTSGTDAPTTGKKGKKVPAVGTSKTEVFAQDIQDRIRLREAETRALADAGVQAEWAKSVAARNFPDRRLHLKEYYRLLFARMVKLDASLKKLVDVRADLMDRRLTQRFAPVDNVREADRSTSGQVSVD